MIDQVSLRTRVCVCVTSSAQCVLYRTHTVRVLASSPAERHARSYYYSLQGLPKHYSKLDQHAHNNGFSLRETYITQSVDLKTFEFSYLVFLCREYVFWVSI